MVGAVHIKNAIGRTFGWIGVSGAFTAMLNNIVIFRLLLIG